jgi:hypothetical protein
LLLGPIAEAAFVGGRRRGGANTKAIPAVAERLRGALQPMRETLAYKFAYNFKHRKLKGM